MHLDQRNKANIIGLTEIRSRELGPAKSSTRNWFFFFKGWPLHFFLEVKDTSSAFQDSGYQKDDWKIELGLFLPN